MIEKIKKEISNLVLKYNGELVNFEYHKKVFGNIVLEIKCNEKSLCFVTDRGEIYCNGQLLCTYDYLRNENKTTPQKLLEIIEIQLNNV